MSIKKPSVGLEQFIEAWETSASVDEVCNRTGLNKKSTYSRAAKYRSEGLPLKKMPIGGGRKKVSLEDKLAILARVRGVAVEELGS